MIVLASSDDYVILLFKTNIGFVYFSVAAHVCVIVFINVGSFSKHAQCAFICMVSVGENR